jgi:hypothetical protein
MNSKLGSEWRKWDFHVHTPYSILKSQYDVSVDDPDSFDKFVRQLFTKAVEKDIWAIGVTDYFCIDGYRHIREKYLGNPEKMAELFPDEGTRKRIGQILVFPNIEMRLNKFVAKGGSSVPIGYHVLFSDEVLPSEIEGSFLHRLTCKTDPDHSRNLTQEGIKAVGAQVKRDNQKKGDDYKVGLEHVTVDDAEVLSVLRDCATFESKYLIAVPVDEDLSSVSWKGRDYLTKKNIYQQCHCYLTSNEGTRSWAIAKGKEEERKREFGSIKPCIWGSDAHSFNRMFEPGEEDCKEGKAGLEYEGRDHDHRYCWVKADLTFEGLMQILCEPEDRIAIQEERPEQHDEHRSIKSIQFHDDDFQENPVKFSEGLTCIIGGRSTGKSLLLRQLARSIDPAYAAKQEERSSAQALAIVGGADVTWRDGQSGERKIIYLPQTYLNRTVDDPESGEGGASEFIEGVLLQNEDISAAHDKFELRRASVERELDANLDVYEDLKARLVDARRRLTEHGASNIFRERERELAKEYKQLSGPGGASKEDLESYSDLSKEKDKETKATSTLQKDADILASLEAPVIPEPIYKGVGCYNVLSTGTAEGLREEIEAINDIVRTQWQDTIERLTAACESGRKAHEARIASIDDQLTALAPKVERSGKSYKAMKALNEERKRLTEAEKIEAEIKGLQERLGAKANEILSSRQRFEDACGAYSKEISPLSESIARGLYFSAEVVWRKSDFTDAITSMLDGRKFAAFARATGRDLQDLGEDNYGDELLRDIWDALLGEKKEGHLQLKGGVSEEDFLRKLFDDWYNVHYVVTNGGDRLDRMSPGKKGLVLLELIIELEQGDCPILIDQPEDDLDNQSIYTELRRFIKESKKRRQIIIVTHNANIALGADAEEIIVANQNGVGRENKGRKFEYRSGAIENNTLTASSTENLPFLERHSIQEHACQILDGGKEAIEQRRRKYSMRD